MQRILIFVKIFFVVRGGEGGVGVGLYSQYKVGNQLKCFMVWCSPKDIFHKKESFH